MADLISNRRQGAHILFEFYLKWWSINALNNTPLSSMWYIVLTHLLSNRHQGTHILFEFYYRGQFWPSGIVIACVCVCPCPWVCQPVCQSIACPRDNSGPVQARIAKFGTKTQKTLVKVPIVLGGNWPWPSRSNLTYKLEFTPFWVCPHHYLLPIQARITKFGPEVESSWLRSLLFWVTIDLDLQGQIWFKKSNFLASPLLEIHNHHITTIEPWVPRLLHRPDCFMVSILCAYLYT